MVSFTAVSYESLEAEAMTHLYKKGKPKWLVLINHNILIIQSACQHAFPDFLSQIVFFQCVHHSVVDGYNTGQYSTEPGTFQ